MGGGADRNRLCACGSGRKFKRCCGPAAAGGSEESVPIHYPGFDIILKARYACPCGSGKTVVSCHGNAAPSSDLDWLERDTRAWPIIIELSRNVLTYLADRSRLLPVSDADARRRHYAMTAGFYGSVAYRNLKAVTTLVCCGQPTEAMSLVREILEADVRFEYYMLFPEEAHKLIASKHAQNLAWIKEQNGKSLLYKVSTGEMAVLEQRAAADRLAYPEIYENGKLWGEPDLKRMAERNAERAIELLSGSERSAWLQRSGGGSDLNAQAAEAHLKGTAVSRSWMVNRFMSQTLHSTIQTIDLAFDWTFESPLRPFNGLDRSDVHQPLMLAIKPAIDIAAGINVVSGRADLAINRLHEAYEVNKEALRRSASARSRRGASPNGSGS